MRGAHRPGQSPPRRRRPERRMLLTHPPPSGKVSPARKTVSGKDRGEIRPGGFAPHPPSKGIAFANHLGSENAGQKTIFIRSEISYSAPASQIPAAGAERIAPRHAPSLFRALGRVYITA